LLRELAIYEATVNTWEGALAAPPPPERPAPDLVVTTH
jgi:hypothetical protein